MSNETAGPFRDRALSAFQVAERWGASPMYVHQRVKDLEAMGLPSLLIAGRRFYLEDEVEAWEKTPEGQQVIARIKVIGGPVASCLLPPEEVFERAYREQRGAA